MEKKNYNSDNFAIQLFEGKKVRIAWDAEQEKYYFSVADIVQVLTDSVDPRDYIKKMLRRDPELKSRWGTICPPTRMMAADGKYYKTQAVICTSELTQLLTYSLLTFTFFKVIRDGWTEEDGSEDRVVRIIQ